MRILRSRRGAGLVDVMVTVFLLSIAGVMFSSTFPAGISSTRQSQEYRVANAIAVRKMEQLRSMNYGSLTQPLLAMEVIDADDTTDPYSFTEREKVANELHGGIGEISIDSSRPFVKKVTITVSWDNPTSSDGSARRSVVLTTLFTDRRTRRIN